MTVQIDFCFSQGIFCCLNEKLRRITIHIDFSYKTIHALFFHFPEQIVCCLTMDGSKNIGMKCSMTNHIIHKSIITLLCIRQIFKSGFLRKCVMIQPIGKKTIHAYSTLHILWTMHMQIRKSRNNHLTSIIYTFCMLIFLRNYRINPLDFSTIHCNITVFINCQRICRWRIHNISMV